MNFDVFKREFVEHIARMARMPGVIDHARHQAKHWAHEFPEEFGDLPELVAEALKKISSKPSTDTISRTQGKHT